MEFRRATVAIFETDDAPRLSNWNIIKIARVTTSLANYLELSNNI